MRTIYTHPHDCVLLSLTLPIFILFLIQIVLSRFTSLPIPLLKRHYHVAGLLSMILLLIRTPDTGDSDSPDGGDGDIDISPSSHLYSSQSLVFMRRMHLYFYDYAICLWIFYNYAALHRHMRKAIPPLLRNLLTGFSVITTLTLLALDISMFSLTNHDLMVVRLTANIIVLMSLVFFSTCQTVCYLRLRHSIHTFLSERKKTIAAQQLVEHSPHQKTLPTGGSVSANILPPTQSSLHHQHSVGVAGGGGVPMTTTPSLTGFRPRANSCMVGGMKPFEQLMKYPPGGTFKQHRLTGHHSSMDQGAGGTGSFTPQQPTTPKLIEVNTTSSPSFHHRLLHSSDGSFPSSSPSNNLTNTFQSSPPRLRLNHGSSSTTTTTTTISTATFTTTATTGPISPIPSPLGINTSTPSAPNAAPNPPLSPSSALALLQQQSSTNASSTATVAPTTTTTAAAVVMTSSSDSPSTSSLMTTTNGGADRSTDSPITPLVTEDKDASSNLATTAPGEKPPVLISPTNGRSLFLRPSALRINSNQNMTTDTSTNNSTTTNPFAAPLISPLHPRPERPVSSMLASSSPQLFRPRSLNPSSTSLTVGHIPEDSTQVIVHGDEEMRKLNITPDTPQLQLQQLQLTQERQTNNITPSTPDHANQKFTGVQPTADGGALFRDSPRGSVSTPQQQRPSHGKRFSIFNIDTNLLALLGLNRDSNATSGGGAKGSPGGSMGEGATTTAVAVIPRPLDARLAETQYLESRMRKIFHFFLVTWALQILAIIALIISITPSNVRLDMGLLTDYYCLFVGVVLLWYSWILTPSTLRTCHRSNWRWNCCASTHGAHSRRGVHDSHQLALAAAASSLPQGGSQRLLVNPDGTPATAAAATPTRPHHRPRQNSLSAVNIRPQRLAASSFIAGGQHSPILDDEVLRERSVFGSRNRGPGTPLVGGLPNWPIAALPQGSPQLSSMLPDLCESPRNKDQAAFSLGVGLLAAGSSTVVTSPTTTLDLVKEGEDGASVLPSSPQADPTSTVEARLAQFLSVVRDNSATNSPHLSVVRSSPTPGGGSGSSEDEPPPAIGQAGSGRFAQRPNSRRLALKHSSPSLAIDVGHSPSLSPSPSATGTHTPVYLPARSPPRRMSIGGPTMLMLGEGLGGGICSGDSSTSQSQPPQQPQPLQPSLPMTIDLSRGNSVAAALESTADLGSPLPNRYNQQLRFERIFSLDGTTPLPNPNEFGDQADGMNTTSKPTATGTHTPTRTTLRPSSRSPFFLASQGLDDAPGSGRGGGRSTRSSLTNNTLSTVSQLNQNFHARLEELNSTQQLQQLEIAPCSPPPPPSLSPTAASTTSGDELTSATSTAVAPCINLWPFNGASGSSSGSILSSPLPSPTHTIPVSTLTTNADEAISVEMSHIPPSSNPPPTDISSLTSDVSPPVNKPNEVCPTTICPTGEVVPRRSVSIQIKKKVSPSKPTSLDPCLTVSITGDDVSPNSTSKFEKESTSVDHERPILLHRTTIEGGAIQMSNVSPTHHMRSNSSPTASPLLTSTAPSTGTLNVGAQPSPHHHSIKFVVRSSLPLTHSVPGPATSNANQTNTQ